MDMEKYRTLFVTEAREHLEGISTDLLALEKDAADRAALDNLFRHAHSIKGMAASMGYEVIAQVSHKLEDIADLARRGVAFDAEAVQLWMDGSDWLAQAVEQVAAGRESDVAMPDIMQAVLQKATAMIAVAPPTRRPTLTRVEAVVPLDGGTAATRPTTPSAGSTTSPGMPAVNLTPRPPASRTEPRMAATPEPPPAPAVPARVVGTARPISLTGSPTLVLPQVTAPPSPRTQPTLMMQAVTPSELLVDVIIREGTATPHVRAFVVHKRISEKLEVLEMQPALAELRRGVFPDQILKLRVRGTLDGTAVRALVTSLPDVADCLVALPQAQPPGSAQVTGSQRAVPDPARTVRVRTELLDELIDSVGEILLARTRLRAHAAERDDPDLSQLADEFARLAQGLHERVMGARMMPVSVVTDRLPRVVRDLSRRRGRDVTLVVEGTEIELDRAILDELHDPVLHLVRNAVDHGHEGHEAREAVGKPRTMNLRVVASRDRDHVVLQLADDGRGMDPAALRGMAVERGLLTAEQAAELSDQGALEIICMPGFSTAEEVDDTSGRGVGMDAVRATVQHLGGQLLMESTVGKGSTFTLRMPLTVAIIRVLLVRGGDPHSVYALPLHRVDHAVDFEQDHVVRGRTDALYPVGDMLAPLHDLGALLGHRERVLLDGPGTVVVVDDVYRPLAVKVDAIVGQQEVVVKPLGEPLSNVPFLSGAALLADGSPTYILDVAKLTSAPHNWTPPSEGV